MALEACDGRRDLSHREGRKLNGSGQKERSKIATGMIAEDATKLISIIVEHGW